jgi:hypothetical protein
MSFNTRLEVPVTTATDGSAMAYSAVANGKVLAIQYVKDDFADTVDFAITTETTGQGLLIKSDVTASAIFYPRAQVHSTAGAGLTYDGTRVIAEPVPIDNERIKISIAQGGDTTSGTFYVTIG